MADTYQSIVTTIGQSTVLQNVIDAKIFKLVKVEICSSYDIDMSEAISWDDMSEATVVYRIEDETKLKDMVRRYTMDDTTIQYRITLGPDIGGSSTNGLQFGSIGLYIQGYEEDGETEIGVPVLFAIGCMDYPFTKISYKSGLTGNTVSFYLNLKVSNTVNIENINVCPMDFFSIPSVDTEENMNDYYNINHVRNYRTTNLGAIGVKDHNESSWTYFLPKKELFGFLNSSFVYSTTNGFVSYTHDTSTNAYTFKAPNGMKIKFLNGYAYNEQEKVYEQLFSTYDLLVDKTTSGCYTITEGAIRYLILENDEYSGEMDSLQLIDVVSSKFIIGPTELISEETEETRRTAKPLKSTSLEKNTYYRSTTDGYTYKYLESSSGNVLTRFDWAVVGKFEIDEYNHLVDFYAAKPAETVDYLTMFEDTDKLQEEIEDLSVKIEAYKQGVSYKDVDETWKGVKTLEGYKGKISTSSTRLYDPLHQSSIAIKTPNPTIELFSYTKDGEEAVYGEGFSSLSTVNSDDKVVTTVTSNYSTQVGGSITIAAAPVTSTSGLKYDNLDSSEYIRINGNSTVEHPVLEMSANIEKQIVNLLATWAQGTEKMNVTGYWNFINEVKAPRFVGIASMAENADLAEMYEADRELPEGTLITFCKGEKEVSIATNPYMTEGVVSSKPGYLLNSNLNGDIKVPVALTGRVPVRIIGPVHKGDFIYHSKLIGVKSINGVAAASSRKHAMVPCIGKALETDLSQEEKLVTCVVRIQF